MARDPERDAAAAAARVQAEDEAGLLQRAAVDVRPQAETAVESVQPGHAPLLVMHERVPDERAIAEQPYVGARFVPAEDFPKRGLLLGVGEHGHFRVDLAKRLPQQVVLKIGPGQRHATRLLPRAAKRGTPPAARP